MKSSLWCTQVQTPMWAAYTTETSGGEETFYKKPNTCQARGNLTFHSSSDCSDLSRVAPVYTVAERAEDTGSKWFFQKDIWSEECHPTKGRDPIKLLKNSAQAFSFFVTCTEKAGWMFLPADTGAQPLLSISQFFYTLLIGASLHANVMCVFRTNLLVMWGPCRALMAPQVEMETVLINMRNSRRSALQWFLIGSWFFLTACFVVGWTYWQAPAACTISMVVAWAMWELYSME